MDIFNFIKTLEIPIIVVDDKSNIICCNNSFEKVFGILSTQKRFNNFKNLLNIQCCMLFSDNMSMYNPIDLAINTEGNFTTVSTYQKSTEEYLTFLISSIKTDDYYVIKFIDLTNEYKLTELENKYFQTNNELNLLKKENEIYLETKEKAQNQAIKMALLNRIFEALGNSLDIDKSFDLTFKELSEIFGFSKVLFAKYNNNDNVFEIKNVYPQKYSSDIAKTFDIEPQTKSKLKTSKFLISNIVPLEKHTKDVALKPEGRILIPVFHTNNLIGVISAVISRQNLNKINDDMLNAISSQLSAAIVQAYLFNEINKKNEQLQTAYTKLEQAQLQLVNSEKMASLGQLVAGVAHEINTPLASINSNNSIFEKIFQLEHFDEEIIDTIKSMVDTDKEAIKRISNIVQSLKRFVRLDEAALQNANINKEIDLTLNLLKHKTKNKIEIIKDYTENDEIKCFPNLLNQVFMNILMNAIQSIEEKGEIYITTKNKDDMLTISIKDTGSGMTEETKEKLFKTGFTTKKIGIGTGLGLMISKDIIEKHKGLISFNSQLGEGTEMIISIPAQR